jgi:hypothetical protein
METIATFLFSGVGDDGLVLVAENNGGNGVDEGY